MRALVMALARVRSALARARELGARDRIGRESDEEFAFHLEMEIAHNERLGYPPGEARRLALLAFGGVQRFRQDTREARGIAPLEDLARDLRHAARRLRRRPGFSIPAVATLALGIATAAAVGTLVWTVLLAPLPLPDADRLVRLEHESPAMGADPVAQSGGTYELYRTRSRTLEAVGIYLESDGVSITDGERPERVSVAMLTPSVFGITGARAALGRLFTDQDIQDDGPARAVLLSHALWTRRYGADSSIVGRTIALNRRQVRVLGVLAPAYAFPSRATGVYYAMRGNTESGLLTDFYLTGIARLRSGVTPEAAQRELAQLLPHMPELFPTVTATALAEAQLRPLVRDLREATVADVRDEIVMLALVVGFVLLVSVANVLNLFLLRAESVSGEVAVSRALGAGRAALVRRFALEAGLVALLAAALAVPLATWGTAARFGLDAQFPWLDELRAGGVLVGTITALSLGIALVLALTSYVRATRSAPTALSRAGTRVTGGRSWRRVQRMLVTAQVALAVTLLVASATAGRSLWRLTRVNLGHTTDRALAFDLPLPFSAYPRYQDAARFQLALLDSLRALPGVTAAEATGAMPLRGTATEMNLRLEGVAGPDATTATGALSFASAGWFRMLSIPLLEGRAFADGDLAGVPRVIVSASLARALFGTTDVLRAHVRIPDFGARDVSYEIVGVVGDVYGERIAEGPLRTLYFPVVTPPPPRDTIPSPFIPREQTSIVLRTSGDPMAQAAAVRRVVHALDPQLPVARMTTLAAMERDATARSRLTMLLLAVAAGSALVLCSVGTFGLVAHAVAGRTRELGIRIALGATPRAVRSLVLREGLVVALLGGALGLAGALSMNGVLRAALYAVAGLEPAVHAAAALAMVLVAGVSSWIPARRASAIDPVRALRAE